jgi:hypothetical protein
MHAGAWQLAKCLQLLLFFS